jgi:hypothetical protein
MNRNWPAIRTGKARQNVFSATYAVMSRSDQRPTASASAT